MDLDAWRNGVSHSMTGTAMCSGMLPVTAGQSTSQQLETTQPFICQTKIFNFIWQTLLSSINDLRSSHHPKYKVRRCYARASEQRFRGARTARNTMQTVMVIQQITILKRKTTMSLSREKCNGDSASGRCWRRLIELQCLTRKSVLPFSASSASLMRRWSNQDLSNGLWLGFRPSVLVCGYLVILTAVKVAWSFLHLSRWLGDLVEIEMLLSVVTVQESSADMKRRCFLSGSH